MTKPIPSKAAIKGHPIHPMLIPFPIVLIPAALAADVVYAVNDGEEHMIGVNPEMEEPRQPVLGSRAHE